MDLHTFMLYAYLTIATTTVPLFFGLIRLKASPVYIKALVLLEIISLACDCAAILKAQNLSGNIYRLFEFCILLFIYIKVLSRWRLTRFFLILGVACVLFFIINLIYVQQEKLNSYSNTISAFVFITLSIGYFYQLLKDSPGRRQNESTIFWINIGVLIYFAGNLFLFLLSDYLINVLKTDLAVFWTFHNSLSVVKNILFTVAILINMKQLRSAQMVTDGTRLT